MVSGEPLGTQVGAIVPSDVVSELAAAGFSEAVQVGQGGLGVVYRCVQQALARVVAVKVLTARFADDRARFMREQQAMARLTSHPNIVTVLQVGQTASGRLYLVMPYCGQGAWQARIAERGALGFDEVLRVGVKIAGAVESAHRVAIVHRDIKPANIMLTDYGEPALGDFGIARTVGLRTDTGAIAGSPAFTAPELATGQAPSAASDVYSLGATLFAALTGHAPFQRHAGQQLVAQFIPISGQPRVELGEHDVPAEVAALVEHAMAREPAERPSALELGQAIQQIQSRRGLAVDEMALHCSDDAPHAGPRPAPLRTSSTRRVPTLPAGVVGWRAELAQLRDMLEHSRLLTVAGIGGVGKTTLATHAASQLETVFGDGVWLVELGDLHAGDLLAETVATALGLRDQTGRPMAEVLRQFLQPRHALLVLDTCEHLIDDAAKLVDTLLRECPALHVITTSREVLNIAGEAVLTLAPLSYPTTDEDLSLSSLAGYDAVSLFVERARAAVPGFALTTHNSAAVARICTQLEGVPLAIELAAVRLRALSVDHIADDLARSYTLLNRGRRGAPTRQQSLTCCIDWSYERCSHAEQHLWAQLSVFAGSFDLLAAHHISTDNTDPTTPDDTLSQCLDRLCALVDKSILTRIDHHATVRFRLLDTVRQYGRQRLSDTAYHALRRRHAAWYEQLLSHVHTQWWGPHQIQWYHRLTDEMPNLREALGFNLSDSPTNAVHMITALRPMWTTSGMLRDGRHWAEKALSATPQDPPAPRINLLCEAVHITAIQGDLAATQTWMAEARHLLQVTHNPKAQARIDVADGYAHMLRGDFERARDYYHRALNETDAFEIRVQSLMMLGWVAEIAGDNDEALRWFEKALALADTVGDSVQRSRLSAFVGFNRWRRGELELAEQPLRQCLQLTQRINDPWTGAPMLAVFAWVAGSRNDPQRAVTLMAAAEAVSRACGATTAIFAQVGDWHQECEHRARQQLSPAQFDAAWSQGDAMTFEQATAFALAEDDS